ncbi:MAG: hypothetical protein IT338_17165 [Thermomicrobiales bacterium]|nr:hypothetical protein [Thermomicrobiales bacterium]
MSQDYFLDRTQGAGAIAAHAPAPRSAPAPMLRGRRALGAINQGGPGQDSGSGASGGSGTGPRTLVTVAFPVPRPRGMPALPAPKPPRLTTLPPLQTLTPVKAQPGRPALSTSTSVTPGTVAPQPGRPASGGGGGGGGGGFYDEIDEIPTKASAEPAAPAPKKLPWWIWAGAAAGGVVLYRTITKRKR